MKMGKVKTPWASPRREESIDHKFVGSRWPPGPKGKTTLDPGFRRRAPLSSHPHSASGSILGFCSVAQGSSRLARAPEQPV